MTDEGCSFPEHHSYFRQVFQMLIANSKDEMSHIIKEPDFLAKLIRAFVFTS